MAEHKITHILSVIRHTLNPDNESFRGIGHLSIDLDDMEDVDILVHLPKMVRFIDAGLKSENGSVLVHCAMGKSRSVTAIVAYLLWKHPGRFASDPNTTAAQAVANAVDLVRETRPIAEPNEGFMKQLELWWEMGRPADSDDAVERAPAYQRWLYKREVEDAAKIGRAPDWIRFEDEEAAKENNASAQESGLSVRCKKCRRVLATKPFIIQSEAHGQDCPHVFVEALSWMRPELEKGELEGRLGCPHPKCGAAVGRYTWQGFRCGCGDWVAPAFSLQKSKVDEVVESRSNVDPAALRAARMAALGIRMPARVGGTGGQGNL